MDAASLRQAICSLYGSCSAGQDQARANAWLNSFSQTPAAWEACLQLLEPSERPEVTFFCANLLLSKVRAEWHKLSPEQAASMGTVIRCDRKQVSGWQAGPFACMHALRACMGRVVSVGQVGHNTHVHGCAAHASLASVHGTGAKGGVSTDGWATAG